MALRSAILSYWAVAPSVGRFLNVVFVFVVKESERKKSRGRRAFSFGWFLSGDAIKPGDLGKRKAGGEVRENLKRVVTRKLVEQSV